MRSTKKPTAKSETDTLRRLQNTAKQIPGQKRPPATDIVSSAEILRDDLDRLADQTLHIATIHHVDVDSIHNEVRRKLRK
jgi:hypothetical protein